MYEWKKKTLGEVTSFISKGIPPKYTETEGNNTVRVLNQKCNRNFEISYAESRIHDCSKKNVMSDKMLEDGDVLINSTGSGTAGRVAQIFQIPVPTTIDGHMILLRPTTELDIIYYGYAVKSAQAKIESLAEGSTGQTEINRRRLLDEIIISYPSDEIHQKNIAKFLLNIDKKIDVNKKINRNLSEQAETLYRKLILDDSGEHRECVLSDIADIVMGQSPKGDTYNEDGDGAVFYQGRAEFGERFPTRRLFTTDPKRMAKENSVLMSVRAPVGDINVAYEECCIGRGLCSVSSKDNHQSFILYTMYSLKDKLDVYNGEGTVFGSINKDSMNCMIIQVPNKELMDKFEEIVRPMDAMIKANYDENCRLVAMRDRLLLKLMSGELDVSEVDI